MRPIALVVLKADPLSAGSSSVHCVQLYVSTRDKHIQVAKLTSLDPGTRSQGHIAHRHKLPVTQRMAQINPKTGTSNHFKSQMQQYWEG